MLSFTTYNIPERANDKTLDAQAWLGIIIKNPLTDDTRDLLQKICTAIHAQYPDDIYFIEYDENVSLASYTTLKFNLIISFGVHPSQLGIWLDMPSAGIRLLESFSFILTGTLEELIKNPAGKKLLWSSMQQIPEPKK